MKTLIFGIVLIVLLGVAGFFYRNVMESAGAPEPVACTMDAKICPDGSAVGRVGPSCAFEACPPPNAEVPPFAFVLPAGYRANDQALGSDPTLLAAFEKSALGDGPSHAIVIRSFPIPAGKTDEDVIVEETLFETSGMGAESIDQFTEETIGGKPFYKVVVERFEAQVHSLYYLPSPAGVVYRFEVLERDVTEWTDPSLVVEELPEHAAFREMLRALEVAANQGG